MTDQIRQDLQSARSQLSAVVGRDDAYVGRPLEHFPWIRLARRGVSLSALLPAPTDKARADTKFANLIVSYAANCVVETAEGRKSEVLLLVECTSADSRTQDAFLDILALVLPTNRSAPGHELESAMTAIADLFSAVRMPARTTVLGLWGELFILSHARDRAAACKAWHYEPQDRYDFSSAGERVDVKTSTGSRRHHFAYEQLRPLADVKTSIISVITEVSASGTSLNQLLERSLTGITGSDRSRVVSVALKSLGSEWSEGEGVRFDEELALVSTRVFDAVTIPSVSAPPPELSGVQFQADLSTVPHVGGVTGELISALIGDWHDE